MSDSGVGAAIFKARRLGREFRLNGAPVTALDGVSIEIHEGEIVAIVGASGAGKSTLLHIMGGLDRPTSGSARYSGEKPLDQMSSSELARFRARSIGFVFQAGLLLRQFTALENVAIAALIAGRSRAVAYESARKILTRVGLAARLDHKPGELSGGEAQRVAVARAMVNSPRVTLCDEPTGALDTKTGMALFDLIRDLLNDDRARAFVIVTHNADIARRADRTFELEDGRARF